MNKITSYIIYALGVLAVYALLVLTINKIGSKPYVNDYLFGIYSQKDILTGIGISAFLTFMRVRKQKK